MIWAGDSTKMLPDLFSKPPHPRCDVFHVDGGHEGETPHTDLQGAINNTRVGGLIIMDDVLPATTRWAETFSVGGYAYSAAPTEAWEHAIGMGQILEVERRDVMGRRGWAAGLVLPKTAAAAAAAAGAA
jgi:hypothetical protein